MTSKPEFSSTYQITPAMLTNIFLMVDETLLSWDEGQARESPFRSQNCGESAVFTKIVNILQIN